MQLVTYKFVGGKRVVDRVTEVARAATSEVLESLHAANPQIFSGVNVVVHIMPAGINLTDLPEFAGLKGVPTPDGRLYENIGGCGGMRYGNTIHYVISEKEFTAADRRYGRGFLATHEEGHVVEEFALTQDQRRELNLAYAARRQAGGPWLPPTEYTSSNVREYFAQCTNAYFETPYDPHDDPRRVNNRSGPTNRSRPNNESSEMYTRQWLKINDPRMYRLLTSIYAASLPPLRMP